MTKKYEKIGIFVFIDGHTPACRKQRNLEKLFGIKQVENCHCKYLYTHLKKKKQHKESMYEKAM